MTTIRGITRTLLGPLSSAVSVEVEDDTGSAQVSLSSLLQGVALQGRQTIWLLADSLVPRTTSGPVSGSVETTTSKVMRKTLDFDAATAQYAQFSIGMPKSWNEGTVTAQFLWTAASGSGAVVWGVWGQAQSDGDAGDAAFGTAVTIADTLLSAGATHLSAETGAITLAGSPAEGDLVVLQFFRDAANAGDTLGVAAGLLGVRLFYTVNAGNDA